MDMQLVPKYADEEPAPASAAAAPSVSLSAAGIRAAGVATVPVTRQNLTDEIRAVGTIEADETKLQRVAARVPGRIERLYANFTGQSVKRGAPLFDLYSPDLVATQRDYLLALENRQRLAGSSPEAIRSAQSLVEAARDRLRLWGISADQIRALERTSRPDLALTYRSPVSGTVVQKNVVEGQYVSEGTDLYFLADLSSVWLVAQVYEFELGRLQVGQSVTATVAAFPGRELAGRIVFIEPLLERETRTARVRVVLPNPRGDLKPGMFADARLALQLKEGLSVPRSAVIDTGARQVVYVETAPGIFTPREVRLGAAAGDRREVLEGLREGEKVVAAANFFVDSQAQLGGGTSIQWSGARELKATPRPGDQP
jgi:Cu(I)/Ag(I) efflux system membrane fusion protein